MFYDVAQLADLDRKVCWPWWSRNMPESVYYALSSMYVVVGFALGLTFTFDKCDDK